MKILSFRAGEVCTCDKNIDLSKWVSIKGHPPPPKHDHDTFTLCYYGGAAAMRGKKKTAKPVRDSDRAAEQMKGLKTRIEGLVDRGQMHQEDADKFMTFINSAQGSRLDQNSVESYAKSLGLGSGMVTQLVETAMPHISSAKQDFPRDFPLIKLAHSLESTPSRMFYYVPADLQPYVRVGVMNTLNTRSRLVSNNNLGGRIKMSTSPNDNISPLMWMLINMENGHWDNQILYPNTFEACNQAVTHKMTRRNMFLFTNMLLESCNYEKGHASFDEKSAYIRGAMNNAYKHVDADVKSLRYTSNAIKAFNNNMKYLSEYSKDYSGTLSEFIGLLKIVYMRPLVMWTHTRKDWVLSYSNFLEIDPSSSVGGITTSLDLTDSKYIVRNSKTNSFFVVMANNNTQEVPLELSGCERTLMDPDMFGNMHATSYMYDVRDRPAKLVGQLGFIPFYINRFSRMGMFSFLDTPVKSKGHVINTSKLQGLCPEITISNRPNPITFKLRGAIVARTVSDMPQQAVGMSSRPDNIDPNTFWQTEAFLFDAKDSSTVYHYNRNINNVSVHDREKIMNSILERKFNELKKKREEAKLTCPEVDMTPFVCFDAWKTDSGTQVYIDGLQKDLDNGYIDSNMLLCQMPQSEVMELISTHGIFLLYANDQPDVSLFSLFRSALCSS